MCIKRYGISLFTFDAKFLYVPIMDAILYVEKSMRKFCSKPYFIIVGIHALMINYAMPSNFSKL
jgi:hypothetical protein